MNEEETIRRHRFIDEILARGKDGYIYLLNLFQESLKNAPKKLIRIIEQDIEYIMRFFKNNKKKENKESEETNKFPLNSKTFSIEIQNQPDSEKVEKAITRLQKDLQILGFKSYTNANEDNYVVQVTPITEFLSTKPLESVLKAWKKKNDIDYFIR